MAATRPGNSDRGWNDPPVFMYNSDGQRVQTSSRKNPLTRRVGMPQGTSQTTAIKPGLPQTVPPGAPTVGTFPHLQAFTRPPTADSVTSPERSGEVRVQGDGQSRVLPDDICETSMAKLRGVLKECEVKLKARVADEIKKRMDVLNVAWKTDKLSTVVQQRMAKLSTALAEREYDKAHDVHLSLMVNYVSEVSQWMVGIKRLIMEARTILPHSPSLAHPDTKEEEDTEQITSSSQEQADTQEWAGDGTKQPGDTARGSLLVPGSSVADKHKDNLRDADRETFREQTGHSTSDYEQDSEPPTGDKTQESDESGRQLCLSDSLSLCSKINSEEEADAAKSETSQDETGEGLDRTPADLKPTGQSGESKVVSDSDGVTSDDLK